MPRASRPAPTARQATPATPTPDAAPVAAAPVPQAPTAPLPGLARPRPAATGAGRTRAGLSVLHTPDGTHLRQQKDQVKYGPGGGLSAQDRDTVYRHVYAQEPLTLAEQARVHEERATEAEAVALGLPATSAKARAARAARAKAVAAAQDAAGAMSDDPATPAPDDPAPGSSARPLESESVVTERLSQYNAAHTAYVKHAAGRRPLTVQERLVADRVGPDGKAANGDGSINHVIASGVGQNTLNSSIAAFKRGQARMPDPAVEEAEPMDVDGPERPAPTARDRAALAGLAQQAAAVGRVQTYNRGFAFENLTPAQQAVADQRSGAPSDAGEGPRPARDTDTERNSMLQQTLRVLQGTDRARRADPGGAPSGPALPEYKSLLKRTFDSEANLRVGHALANGVVSTGFDGETRANPDHDPADAASTAPRHVLTERSRRLREVHLAAAPDHDQQIVTTFADEPDVLEAHRGVALSSSTEWTPQAAQETLAAAQAEKAARAAPPAPAPATKRGRPAAPVPVADATPSTVTKRQRRGTATGDADALVQI